MEKRGVKGKRKWDGNDVNVALMYEILKKKNPTKFFTKKKEEKIFFQRQENFVLFTIMRNKL